MYVCLVCREYNLSCVEFVGVVFNVWHIVFVVHSVCGYGTWYLMRSVVLVAVGVVCVWWVLCGVCKCL